MEKIYRWSVTPSDMPAVVRSCPKCGNSSEYVCSGNFRVNANQSRIDVWLIYQCKKCKSTWNMEILSRVNRKAIDKELFQKFQNNDPELAARYAYDAAVHRKNKSVPLYDNIQYEINGMEVSLPELREQILVQLSCEYSLDIRLDKLLSKKLGISREQFKKMCLSGMIFSDQIQDIGKARVRDGLLIHICPSGHHNASFA